MGAPPPSHSDAPRPRRRLFWKYVVVIVALVTAVLVASAGVELWFSYRENQDAITALQHEKAAAAATRIELFIREIERQMGWTTQPLLASGTAALEQRRIDFLRLLRQVPAITELSHVDSEGKEQLRVSRLAMDVAGSGVEDPVGIVERLRDPEEPHGGDSPRDRESRSQQATYREPLRTAR